MQQYQVIEIAGKFYIKTLYFDAEAQFPWAYRFISKYDEPPIKKTSKEPPKHAIVFDDIVSAHALLQKIQK